MKNKSIQSFLMVFAIMLSAFCFIYLNSMSTSSVGFNNDEVELKELTKQTEAPLPDVKIVKHIVDVAKKVLPVPQ